MKTFLSFFRPLYVTAFLVIVIEALQLELEINYMSPHLDFKEVLKLGVASLFLLLFVALGLAAAASIISSASKHLKKFARALTEISCVSVLLLLFIPAVLVVFHTSFPHVMKTFWSSYNGAVPALIVLAVILLRLVFKKGFKKRLKNFTRALWLPSLVISNCLFIWIGTGLLSSAPRAVLAADALTENEPNIILITFDGLSARDMSLYGYGLPTTPFFEEFAKESFVFTNTHANYNRTVGSTTSILTGKYPWSHGQIKPGLFIRKDKRHEQLASMIPDFHRAAIAPSNYVYIPFLGLNDGFDFAGWSDLDFHPALDSLDGFFQKITDTKWNYFSMPIVRHFIHGDKKDKEAETFKWAAKHLSNEKKRPVFLWTHIWPPHDPYNAPPPYSFTFLAEKGFKQLEMGYYKTSEEEAARKTRLLYDEYILFADAALGRFINNLKILGLYDTSIIIISADHGEIFEKGWTGHTSPYLYEPEIHIPLLIRMPGQSEGKRLGVLAEHIDIAPTVLDLLGRNVPEWMEGESLVPYMKGEKRETEKTKFSMVFHTFYDEADHPVKVVAAYMNEYKLIYDINNDTAKLFNLRLDPDEENNLAEEKPEIVLELKDEILNNIENTLYGANL